MQEQLLVLGNDVNQVVWELEWEKYYFWIREAENIIEKFMGFEQAFVNSLKYFD